jgi:hypothetical protein
MPALYTALAILGLIAAGLILFAIAWAVLSFERIVDYAAELFDDEDGKVADAWGEVVRVPDELRTGQRIGSGLGDAAYRAAAGPSRTHTQQQLRLPSTRFLPSGEEGSI